MTLTVPNNRIVAQGSSYSIEARVETVANVYPGRYLKKGTTDDDVAVAGAGDNPVGIAGFEQPAPAFKPTTIDTIYAVNDRIPVVSAKGSLVRTTLTTSQTIVRGVPSRWRLIVEFYPG